MRRGGARRQVRPPSRRASQAGDRRRFQSNASDVEKSRFVDLRLQFGDSLLGPVTRSAGGRLGYAFCRANRQPAEVVRRGPTPAPCVLIRTSAARQSGRRSMLRRTMPNQVAVRAAGGCGALPDDDSYEFVFYRNPTPIWFHDLDTRRFLGLTPGVVTPWACQGPRGPRQSSPAVLPARMASPASASPRASLRCPDSRRPCRALHPRWR